MKINSERLKQLRMARQWSQEQLSEACGLNLRTVQRLESGGNASIESLRALAAVFGVQPESLILIEKDDNARVIDAIQFGVMNFANFSGRSKRFEYWWLFLLFIIVAAVATVIHPKAYQIVAMISLLPLIAAGSRRLRDSGRSPWWQLFFLVPFGFIIVLYLLAMPSADEALTHEGGQLDPNSKP